MFAIKPHVQWYSRLGISLHRAWRLSVSPKPAYTSDVRRCRRSIHSTNPRAAKRVAKKQVKELVQGPVAGAALPPSDKDDLKQESLLDVVRNYMRKFPNCVLLTKVGNFYELYYEHAEEYSSKLGLRCAAKGKDGVPMAGFQLPQLDKYLKILVQDLDKHVAICQEFPEYVDGKLQSPIPRRVTRIVTPGTLIDEEFVEQDKNNFLLSIYSQNSDKDGTNSDPASQSKGSEVFGLAWVDISTGEFFLQTTTQATLLSSLLRIGATEVVLSNNLSPTLQDQIATSLGLTPERLASSTQDSSDPSPTDSTTWTERLDEPIDKAERSQITDSEDLACQQLFEYIDRHLLEIRLKPKRPQRIEQSDNMAIDRSSIRGLELLKTARDGLGKGSLINTIQRTVTKGGSRLLRERIIYPSVVAEVIEYRLDLVSAFLTDVSLHETILVHLRYLFDVRRISQKFALGRGDAEDLLQLAKSIGRMDDIVRLLRAPHSVTNKPRHSFVKLISQLDLEAPQQLCRQIKTSIDEQGLQQYLTHTTELSTARQEGDADADDPAAKDVNPLDGRRNLNGGVKMVIERPSKDDPWIMQKGASTELKSLHKKLQELEQKRLNLQESLRDQLSSPKLVLRYDPKFGHICQTPRNKNFNESKLGELSAVLVGHMKTVRSFYLNDWTKLGREMDNLRFDIRSEEQKIFHTLRQLVITNLVPLRKNASAMDELDVSASFATLALDEGWVRPKITDKAIHTIVGGRHATVNLGLKRQGQSFVSNDLNLDRTARVWLITGPNMAGKSTFLRQNALITILAQIGCYVPAAYAEIGIVDKIFSRIGAADDLFRNESTFMVEMLETASILKDATERSFVIMDEVGRGTAPEEGTAVAYASLHHLYHVNKCRTLFATHFHDVADKTKNWPELAQYCTDIREDKSGAFVFLHKLQPGVNKNSHALKVAKMAGLPPAALEIAQQMLTAGKGDRSAVE